MRYHTQTTDSLLDKFNGREGKQHMAVCRISFVCFVNKFPPESALTPPARRPAQDRKLSKCSFSLGIFSICFGKWLYRHNFVWTLLRLHLQSTMRCTLQNSFAAAGHLVHLCHHNEQERPSKRNISKKASDRRTSNSLEYFGQWVKALLKRYWISKQLKVQKLVDRLYGFIYCSI